MPDKTEERRPWKWEWDSINTIAIYEPSDGLYAKVVASIRDEEYDDKDRKTAMESTATLICEAVNKALEDEEYT